MKRQPKTAASAVPAQAHSTVIAPPSAIQAKRFVDRRPSALAQRELTESIAQSPRMVAQREQIAMMRSVPLQRTGGASHTHTGTRAGTDLPPNRTGLPDTLKAGVESLAGMTMDHVRVHYNSDKPAALNAHAYAQGGDIHVAPGQERHLPHEAWHVVQQAQGRVAPTRQMKGDTAVNDDPALESEADVFGARALGAGQRLAQDDAEPLPAAPSSSSRQPAQLARYTWTAEGRWVDDGKGSTSHAVGPKPVGDFVGQIYDDSTGRYSTQVVPFHDYLDPSSFEGFQPIREARLPVGGEQPGHTGPIAMPLELVGDLAERLLNEWIQSTGIVPRVEQNASGHGLDMSFEITADGIRRLPAPLRGVFSSVVPTRTTVTTKRGRQTRSRLPTDDDGTVYFVVFEVKANSAQLSKAQRDSDKYVYKQSKKGFGLSARQAIESGQIELFYEVNVNIEEGATHEASFEFIRRDDKTSKGLPRQSDRFNHRSEEPFEHLNSKDLGDAGEQFAKETLALAGYTSIGSLQRSGGQGVDIVALDPSDRIVFFEVKTHLGTGKTATLTQRERQQHAFVTEILFHIIEKSGDYAEVPDHVRNHAWEVYQSALHHDQEARERRGEPIVGLGGVDTDAVVRRYLADLARYYVIDVYFPELGGIGQPTYSVSHWKGDQ